MAKIDIEINTKFKNHKHRFIANLVFTSNWFENKVGRYLKPYEISFQQFNILRILRGSNDWLTMNEIKALMVEKSPNTTRLADKLFEKGLVDRKRSDSDRRVVYLMITAKGNELLTTVDNHPGDYLEFMDRITDQEAKFISDVFDKMRG